MHLNDPVADIGTDFVIVIICLFFADIAEPVSVLLAMYNNGPKDQ